MKSLPVVAFSLFIMFFSISAIAQDSSAHKSAEVTEATSHEKSKEGEFDVTSTILEHISDNYYWHTFGHHAFPLPVILHTDKGFEVFSSEHLINEEHEPVIYNGNYPYKIIEKDNTVSIAVVDASGKVDEEATGKILDISITKNVTSMFITVAILLVMFLSVAKAYKKRGVTSAPKGFQSFMEPLILFVRDEIAKPYLGHQYKKYMPFLLSVFFFIWVNNLLGLIPFFPGGANVSGNIGFTLALALFTFVIVNINGNKDYWGHIFWMPGLPVPMKIFLMPIEFLGVFIKPISLMIRLFANITAGHILVLSLICLIFIFKSIAASAMAVPFAMFINAIELLVAFLQAFIFTMLSALYIGMAIEEHHHHDEAHA
ncbi:F0F1 ATP synthase subunit A [Chitinophagaceae bacterium LWZ2-11]